MKSKWEHKTLGDICVSELGKTLNQSKDTGTLRPYLCAINIQWDCLNLQDLKKARFEDDELERYSVQKGDLLVCEGGDVGRAALWERDEPMLYQNALHRIRFTGGCYPRFYLFCLRHLKNKGVLDSRFAKGVTIKHLVKSSLLSIPVPVPPLDEQQRIVAELDLLTSVIDKRKMQLKELDTLAQSIFYDMFGDPIENPKGWDVKKLGDVCDLKAGKNIKASELRDDYEEGLYPCYGGNGIRGFIAKFSHQGTFPIIGRQGALCGNVQLASGVFYATEHAVVCKPLIEFESHFLFFVLVAMNLNQYAQGVAQPGLAVQNITPLPIIIPPLALQQNFADKIQSIEKQKTAINQSIAETQKLLDYTMDKYFG